MDKKKLTGKQAAALVGAFLAGAGAMYLVNMNKINFGWRYPEMMRAEKFVRKKLDIGGPENADLERQVNAFLSLYGDRYTRYDIEDIESSAFVEKEFNKSGVAFGSGFSVAFGENDEPYISDLDPEGAAYSQGIRQGDVIVSIDGKECREPRNVNRLKGEDGEPAELVISRNGEKMTINFVRVCDNARGAGVTSKMYGDTLYLRIEEFNYYFPPFAEDALAENSFKNLILDLRGNPGGDIMRGMEFVDMFIDRAVLTQHAKNGEEEQFCTSDGIDYNVPIVVLADGDTASSAEMVVAFLKQYADTTFIGTKTFGKAIYQKTAFYKGGTLSYTEGYATVGDWECYNGVGIYPDIELPMAKEFMGTENDTQLQEALKFFGESVQ